jgi:hypothetical protein
MKLKKFGTVMVAILAIGAVMASSAFATATTTAQPWTVGSSGTKLESGKTKTVTASASGATTFKSTVSGTTLELSSSNISCVECVITGGSSALGSGKIKYSEVKVLSPSTCKVSGETITTNQLNVEADYMEGESALQKFVPAAGSSAAFATIKLERGTGACAIAGSYNVTGTVFGLAANKTGVLANPQSITFSESINKNAGGTLKLKEEPAVLTGTALFSIGEAYGVG